VVGIRSLLFLERDIYRDEVPSKCLIKYRLNFPNVHGGHLKISINLVLEDAPL
jgi:hypothetical protein